MTRLAESKEQFTSKNIEASHDATFDQIRLALGYSDEYAAQLTWGIMALMAVSLILLVLSALIRCCCFKNFGRGWFSVANVTVRLCYFLFLEICLSLYINFNLHQVPTTGSEFLDPIESTTARTQYATFAVAVMTIFILSILLAGLCCGNCGP